MHFRYGSYNHPTGLVVASYSFRRISGNYPRTVRTMATWSLSGVLIGSGATTAAMQADLSNKIRGLESAYGVDGQDCGLILDNGTKSANWLDSNRDKIGDSVGPTRVTELSYPDGDGAEYATQRSYRITIEAEIASHGSGLESFSESVSQSGDGGPRFVYIEVRGGPVFKQQVSEQTMVLVVQSGSAVGYLTYPAFPVQLLSGLIDRTKTRKHMGPPEWDGSRWLHWPVSWSYSFVAPSEVTVFPTRI